MIIVMPVKGCAGSGWGCPYPALNTCWAGPEWAKALGGPVLPRPLLYP